MVLGVLSWVFVTVWQFFTIKVPGHRSVYPSAAYLLVRLLTWDMFYHGLCLIFIWIKSRPHGRVHTNNTFQLKCTFTLLEQNLLRVCPELTGKSGDNTRFTFQSLCGLIWNVVFEHLWLHGCQQQYEGYNVDSRPRLHYNHLRRVTVL